MTSLFLAVCVSIALYLIVVSLIPRDALQSSTAYTRHMLTRLKQEHRLPGALDTEGGIELQDPADSPLVRGFLLLPGAQKLAPVLQRADEWQRLDKFVLAFLLLFLFLTFALGSLGVVGLPLALLGTVLGAALYLNYRMNKRRQAFILQFPEALEAIVRSVRAGYPLSTAVGLVAQNLGAPMGPEFRRVADEAAYGTPLLEAFNRMAERLDLPDVRFFTVVLAVQQESGGGLAEVLSNLSAILRKRKQLRDKIVAISSEGRTTAWVLFILPFLIIGAVHFSAPGHFLPLITTTAGNIVLGVVGGMMVGGMLTVRQIVRMEV